MHTRHNPHYYPVRDILALSKSKPFCGNIAWPESLIWHTTLRRRRINVCELTYHVKVLFQMDEDVRTVLILKQYGRYNTKHTFIVMGTYVVSIRTTSQVRRDQ